MTTALLNIPEKVAVVTGRRAHVVVADLRDLDTVAALADTAVAEFGRLDIVVNNVGGTVPRPFDVDAGGGDGSEPEHQGQRGGLDRPSLDPGLPDLAVPGE